MKKITCPECGAEIEITPETAAGIMGSKGGKSRSPEKLKAVAENAKRGGRPRVKNPVRKRPYHKEEEL